MSQRRSQADPKVNKIRVYSPVRPFVSARLETQTHVATFSTRSPDVEKLNSRKKEFPKRRPIVSALLETSRSPDVEKSNFRKKDLVGLT